MALLRFQSRSDFHLPILPEMTPESADRLQTLIWIVLGLTVLWLLFLLSPILSPFLLAGILAYICAPLVARLENLGLPRLVAVPLVMLLVAATICL